MRAAVAIVAAAAGCLRLATAVFTASNETALRSALDRGETAIELVPGVALVLGATLTVDAGASVAIAAAEDGGSGAATTLDGADGVRLLYVSGALSLAGLTLARGRSPRLNQCDQDADTCNGGAIFVAASGELRLDGVTFAGNTLARRGGALYTQGYVYAERTVFEVRGSASATNGRGAGGGPPPPGAGPRLGPPPPGGSRRAPVRLDRGRAWDGRERGMSSHRRAVCV